MATASMLGFGITNMDIQRSTLMLQVHGDATSTSPTGGNWTAVRLGSNSTTTISHAEIRYGGYNNTYKSNLHNDGGVADLSNITIASSSNYGIFNKTGTTTVAFADIHDNSFGVYSTGGTFEMASSTISDNTNYGVYNGTTNTIDAENNYWGAFSGPYHSVLNPDGDGNAVSDYVDFDPWLTESP